MDIVTLSYAKRLIYNAIAGLDGPIAGKNCKIQSVEDITGGHRITFSWSDDEGVARTSTLDVMDGRGIESVEIKYASSQSGTNPPSSSSEWSTTVPSVPDGYYLWTRNTLTFSDGSTEIEYLVGKQGFSPIVAVTNIPGGHRVTITDQTSAKQFNVMDGLAIDHITVDYAESSSGTIPPSDPSDWQNSPPVVAAGNYLWTRNTTYLEDNTTSVAYMVALQGAAGISPDVETTQLPNGTLVTITDKDGPHPFTIYNGEDGTDGRDGADGADGFSPIITTNKVDKTTTITIVDATGTTYATILDGADGKTITNITINSSNHVIVTYSDGTSSDAGELIVQSAVMSVNGQTGTVVLDAENVGALPDDTPLFSGDYDDLTNKPNLATVATSGDYDDLTNKPTIPADQIQSDWNQTDNTQKDYIKNKPTIPAAQVNSDWNSSSGVSQILNKPTLGTAAALDVASSGNASSSQVVKGNDTRLTDARTPTSHTHTKSEITDFPALGTASEKNYTTSVSDGGTDLPTSGAVKTAIDSAISRVYKPAGNKTVAELTSALLIAANLGNVYNMTTSGQTTSDFVEGAGKPIDVGANVAVVDIGTSSTPSYKFDLLSGMVDMSNFVQKSNMAGLLKNDGSVDATAYAKQSEMSVTNGTGTDSDKVTIQLKSGTSATVLKTHQDISGKVDKVDGKGLSTNDYTTAEKDKLAGIATGAEVNVQSDWNQSDSSKDDFIKNKPTIPSVSGKADKVSGATSGNFAALDSTGNLADSGKNSDDFIPTEIASSLPTDSVLHYSFDELPDYPDGTADYRPDFNTSNGGWTSDSYCTFSHSDGMLKMQCAGNANEWRAIQQLPTSIRDKILLIKVRANFDNAHFIIQSYTGSTYVNVLVTDLEKDKWYTFQKVIPNSYNGPLRLQSYVSSDTTRYFEIKDWYIGDGSYVTPIIDNANGQYNSISQSGVAVSGVSGKAYKGFDINYVRVGKKELADDFSISIWVNPDNNTNGLVGNIIWKSAQFILRNGTTWGNYLMFYLYQGGDSNLRSIGALLTPNKWTHLVITKDGTSLKAYRDGVNTNTFTLTSATFDKNDNEIYVHDNTNTRPQSYDDLLIFDRALSDSEVKALYYNHGNTPKYYPPLTMVDSGLSTESSNPVENKIITSKFNEITETASSLPTDSVLHYSFDEVPDYPDGTAVYKHIKDFTTTSGWVTGSDFTLTIENGGLKITPNNTARNYMLARETNVMNTTTLNRKVVKMKVRSSFKPTTVSFQEQQEYRLSRLTLTDETSNEYTYSGVLSFSTTSSVYVVFEKGSTIASTDYVIIESLYIGGGSYVTPIIDNAGGQWNSTSQSGVAVSGVSGKGFYFPSANQQIVVPYRNPTSNDNITISLWLNIPSSYNYSGEASVKAIFATGAYAGLFGFYRQGSEIGFISRDSTYVRQFGFTPDKDVWLSLVAVYNGTTHSFKLYCNGELKATSASNLADYQFGTTWYLWGNAGRGGSTVTLSDQPATIDDLLIFDRALSDTEILALYQNRANTPKYFPTPTKEIKQDSWELATSGAVQQAISQITETNVIYDTTITDCNNMYQMGKSLCYYAPSATSNIPNSNNAWYILSQCNPSSVTGNAYITQFAKTVTTSSNEVYIRHKYLETTNMVWTSWERLVRGSELVTLGNAKADKVLNATAGHLASLDSNGNLTDSGIDESALIKGSSVTISEAGGVRYVELGTLDVEYHYSTVTMLLEYTDGSFTNDGNQRPKGGTVLFTVENCSAASGTAAPIIKGVTYKPLNNSATTGTNIIVTIDTGKKLHIYLKLYVGSDYTYKVKKYILYSSSLFTDTISVLTSTEGTICYNSSDDSLNKIMCLEPDKLNKLNMLPQSEPVTNGTYVLKCVKDSSGRTYSWVREN